MITRTERGDKKQLESGNELVFINQRRREFSSYFFKCGKEIAVDVIVVNKTHKEVTPLNL